MSNESSVRILKKAPKGKTGGAKLDTSEIIFKVISYLFITIFALLCLYPLVFALSGAVSSGTAVMNGQVVLFPVGFQLKAIEKVIKSKSFWNSYCNTLFVTLYGTIYCMGLSIFGAYALSKKRLYGHKLFNFLLIFTMWFSAGVIPMHLNYQATGQILQDVFHIQDQKWLIVLAMGMSAFNIILLRNAFESVPKEIEEAATVDGANDFQIMSKIYVPMSKATVATVGLFYGISRWNGYFWAAQEVSSSVDFPLQVQIQTTIKMMEDQISEIGADAVIANGYATQSFIYAMVIFAIVPILVIYPFIQKYFAAGVNLGGVKE